MSINLILFPYLTRQNEALGNEYECQRRGNRNSNEAGGDNTDAEMSNYRQRLKIKYFLSRNAICKGLYFDCSRCHSLGQ